MAIEEMRLPLVGLRLCLSTRIQQAYTAIESLIDMIFSTVCRRCNRGGISVTTASCFPVQAHEAPYDAPVGSTGFVYVTFSTATFSAPFSSFRSW